MGGLRYAERSLFRSGPAVSRRLSAVSRTGTPTALREMKRLGLVPGTGLIVDPGTRNASLLVRIDGSPFKVEPRACRGILVVQRIAFWRKTGSVLADRTGVTEGT